MSDAQWFGSFEAIVTASVAVSAVLSVVFRLRGLTRPRIALAATLFAIMAGFYVGWAFGWRPLTVVVWPDARVPAVLAAATTVAALGLARRLGWARWLGLGLAAAGAVSSGLNFVAVALQPSGYWWATGISALGAGLIMVNLIGASVREQFADRTHNVWTSGDPIVRSIRVAIVASMLAVPMLLVYAWVQPIVPGTSTAAVILAAVLSVATGLAIRRKVVGAIMLVLTGVALVVFVGALLWLLPTVARPDWTALEIIGYYGVFWLPAGLAAIIAGLRLAGPVVATLRQLPPA